MALAACKSEIHLLSHENNPKNDEDLGAHTSDGAADGEKISSLLNFGIYYET